MNIAGIYKRFALSSPRIEVLLRQLYWKNVKKLGKYNPHKANQKGYAGEGKSVEFDDILNYLKSKGVGEGTILIVHSSYEALCCTGLEPDEIIEKLLSLVGTSGTLAMPAIRKFKGESIEYENCDVLDYEFEYNTRKTKLTSGLLPFIMLKRKDSEISRFPYNPLVAIGKHAKDMMEHNIDGEFPTPHGKNSAWKYCVDHNAVVIGLGVSLEHYNTTIHVAEEAYDGWRWNDEDWYCKRNFLVVDGDFRKSIVVRDRKAYWGKLHLAEMNLWRDLTKNGIVETKTFNGVLPVSVERADDLVSFLRKKNKKGYPYC